MLCVFVLCTSQVLHPSGDYAVTSNRSGKLSAWDLQAHVVTAAAAAVAGNSSGSGIDSKAAAVTKQPLHVELSGQDGSIVDCLRFLSGGCCSERVTAQTGVVDVECIANLVECCKEERQDLQAQDLGHYIIGCYSSCCFGANSCSTARLRWL